MAGSNEDKPPEKGKPLAERLRDFVEGVLDDLKALLDPPQQPVRIPVSAGPRRR